MRVVVFASQKGGSGKSTLAGHLAVQAQRAGCGPVAIIDTAPLGTLAAWHGVRKADAPTFVSTTPAHLAAELANLRRLGTRLVVIDTPPTATATIRDAVGHADLVIIPARPSPHDLRAVGATLDIVEGLGKPFMFILNGATPFARITLDAAMALAQNGTLPPVTIYHRVDYASSMIDGRTVMECDPESRSAWEIAELWDCVFAQLGALPRAQGDLEAQGGDDPSLATVSGNVIGFGRRLGQSG
ncbi:MAG: division plane positioning ATPase MipZ [Alphaproteobacteria bacterium]